MITCIWGGNVILLILVPIKYVVYVFEIEESALNFRIKNIA